MKLHIKYIAGMAAIASMLATGCKKDFFNRPPESGVTVGNYYQTADQGSSQYKWLIRFAMVWLE